MHLRDYVGRLGLYPLSVHILGFPSRLTFLRSLCRWTEGKETQLNASGSLLCATGANSGRLVQTLNKLIRRTFRSTQKP